MPAQLHLNLFLLASSGHHVAAWRHAASDPRRTQTLDFLVECAEIAEAAKFDSIFLAGSSYVPESVATSDTEQGYMFDNSVVLGALAARTSRIGLIETMSTMTNAPYNLARQFATVDLLSGGRAGWNIVTSFSDIEARNFGMEGLPAAEARYAQAEEFVAVVKQLWDSWEPDACVVDKGQGLYVDRAKVHEIEHVGEHYSVRGPLTLPRMVQRYPLLVQAGASPAGRSFAARHADAVFTAQPTLDDAKSFYADLKSRAERHGRSRDEIKVLPGVAPIVGATEADAQSRRKELTDLILPEVGVRYLSQHAGVDVSGFALDDPVPAIAFPEGEIEGTPSSRTRLILDYIRRESPTLRDLMGFVALGRGHVAMVGTGEQIAQEMEEWVRVGAADGFNVLPPLLPSGLADFAAEVVPVLQERGAFRTDYGAGTLRAHYGLPLAAIP